jgi:formate C-acetyltransferase
VEKQDIPGYAIAGCQEPLIAGKENGNTTNSWLNLPKILELTLNDGRSMITGDKLGLSWTEAGYKGLDEVCGSLEEAYWRQFDFILGKMVSGANGCTECLSRLASPFSSVIMGCLDSGRDMRDAKNPGTKYSGSGCLVHGVSVLSDSLGAAERFIKNGIDSPENLLAALKADFKGYEKIRSFLLAQPKYGNAGPEDARTARLGAEVCRKISEKRNSAGARFNPDFSTPSTHLLYGHWVGATPDGRNARSMLGYGVDPRPGAAAAGFNSRLLSLKKLDFSRFSGGYASHIGVDPAQFSGAASFEEKARLLKKDVINPLFSFGGKKRAGKESCAPFYVYFNIDSEPHLRAVLANPRRHAPNGVYIIRIHGTFVNFLDLSPAIQQDIMERLDPESAKLEKV